MRTRNASTDRPYRVQIGDTSTYRAGARAILDVTDGTTTIEDVDSLTALGGDVNGGASGDESTVGILSYRSLVAYLTNATGAALAAGDVVIIDPATDEAVDVTTTARTTVPIGVVREGMDDGELGTVTIQGYAPLVNVTASVTRGHYAETSTTAGAATANSSRRTGSFGVYLTGGTAPSAILFGASDAAASTAEDITYDNTSSGLTATNVQDAIDELEASGGGGGGGSFHGCSLYNSTNLAFPTVSEGSLTMDSENYDTDAYHDTSSNTQRVTIPTGLGGKYLLTVTLRGSTNNETAYVAVRKNGTGGSIVLNCGPANVGTAATQSLYNGAVVLDLAQSDTLDLRGLSAAAQNALAQGSATGPWLTLTKVG